MSDVVLMTFHSFSATSLSRAKKQGLVALDYLYSIVGDFISFCL